MKLKKYEDKNKKKRKILLVSLGVIVLIGVSLILYKTFAIFTESAEFSIMNGKVDYFGNSDVYFAFFNGNDKLEEMPQKDNEENLVFDYGTCDNGADIIWDNENWGPMVKNLSKSKTKCSLYFKEKLSIEICNKYGNDSASCYITKLGDSDYVNMFYDHAGANGVEVNNLRYVGLIPNNYIDIGDRDSNGEPILWRIIGVMNNITNLDDGGRQESLVKIIRAESIGDYSWDSSAETINNGWGINEWSEADIMKLLNPNTVYSGTPAIGGSLYWNRERGSCYSDLKETNKPCDFTSSGISDEAKKKIVKVRWNTGTFAIDNKTQWTASAIYEAERGNHNGKEQCTSNGGGTYCNDEVLRTTTWDGYLGLMASSDFGYAVATKVRSLCLEKSVVNYNNGICNLNNWLYIENKHQWTLNPHPNSIEADRVLGVDFTGFIGGDDADVPRAIRPVGFLKSSTKITGGTGEIGSPFIATIDE